MLPHAGPDGEEQILNLINLSWDERRLPKIWKKTIIQPIPKPKDTNALRPISLLRCLGKAADKMVLAHLR